MLYFTQRTLTDAKVWIEYSPVIEIAESLMNTLKGLVRASGLPAELFQFERLYMPLSEEGIYAYASVDSFTGRAYELAYNGSEFLFYSTTDVGADEGWCFTIPKDGESTQLKLQILVDAIGVEFLNQFANLLQS